MKLLDILNEDAEVYVPKEKKRVQTVFKALRTGVMIIPDAFNPEKVYKIKYVLNNDYQLSLGVGVEHNNTILFVISDRDNPKMKLYKIGDDGTEKRIDTFNTQEAMFKKIAEKFKHFKIHLR
jgi:hypothetical protein